MPVHRPRVLARQQPLIRLIEISDQLSARQDFILLEAGLSTRPGVSRDAASALNVQVVPLEAHTPEDLARAVALASALYRGYRFPPEIISYAVWLYLRFSLSLLPI